MRIAVLLIVALGTAAASGWYTLCLIQMEYHYQANAEFDSVPPDDDVLLGWLLSQPGVRTAVVERKRIGNRWLIQFRVVMNGNAWGSERKPDIDAAAAERGYDGQAKLFRDAQLVAVFTRTS